MKKTKNIAKLASRKFIVDRLQTLVLDKIKPKIGGEDADQISSALAEHIMAGKEDKFAWDNGNDQEYELEISDDDIKEIENDVKIFHNKELPIILEDILSKSTGDLVRQLFEDWPEQKIWERSQANMFGQRLELRWGRSLDFMRMLLLVSREIGEGVFERFNKSKAVKNHIKKEALLILHMRACQTSSEILTLMERGYADGAMARWRTLYEIGIVVDLVKKFGDEIAERYFYHEIIEQKNEVHNCLKGIDEDEISNNDKRERRIVDGHYKEVIKKYGKEFSSPYGWAAHHLNKKRPTFQNLEEAAGQERVPHRYKLASYKIHAGIKGAAFSFGVLDASSIVLAGASNAGLSSPGINTCFTLTQITGCLYGVTTNIDRQVELRTLCILRDKAELEFLKAEKKLRRDERKFQKNSL